MVNKIAVFEKKFVFSSFFNKFWWVGRNLNLVLVGCATCYLYTPAHLNLQFKLHWIVKKYLKPKKNDMQALIGEIAMIFSIH